MIKEDWKVLALTAVMTVAGLACVIIGLAVMF